MVSTAAVQLGILAACVVLFVPMGLAGLHLSRNKMLFFGGALFISLAVLVHLSPYLPSLFILPSSFSSATGGHTAEVGLTPLSCLPSLPRSLRFLESSFSFSPDSSSACDFKKLSRSDCLDLLNGSWILVAGDSQSRLLVLSFLDLVLDPSAMDSVNRDLFRRHSDYHIQIPDHGITLDFLWSPYESNISSSIRDLKNYPDVFVAGSGLWHMLHVTDAADYGKGLAEIRRLGSGIQSHMFWMGLPTLMDSMLNTEEKRARMNRTMWAGYEREVERSGILRRDGGPFLLLDVGLLSKECGLRCTTDGMHYDKVVYDAAVQVMLIALLIESQQRI